MIQDVQEIRVLYELRNIGPLSVLLHEHFTKVASPYSINHSDGRIDNESSLACNYPQGAWNWH